MTKAAFSSPFRPLLLAALFLPCACQLLVEPLVKGTRKLQVPYSPAKPLLVETVNGGVSITRKEGKQILIEARIAAQTRERLDRFRIRAERRKDGTLEISPLWPGGKRLSRESCSFEIQLPGARNVQVRTSNGRIFLEGMAGEARLQTSNGRIHVQGQKGPVWAKTSNGPIILEEIQGEVTARSSNGSLQVTGVTGPVKARTSNGRAVLLLSASNPGPFDLTTSNGSMEIQVSPSFSGIVDLETSNGRIEIEGKPQVRILESGKTHFRFALGEGKTLSKAATSNGRITFRVK